MLDTCIWVAISEPDRGVSSEQPAIDELLEFERERRVALAKADTVDVERTSGAKPSLAEERILETAGTIEVHGPFVLNHSRLDHSVFGSSLDETGIAEVLALVHPERRLDGTSRSGLHDVRDALHIWTAIRYGYNGFVTTDGAVLESADRFLHRGTGSIRILSPVQAVAWLRREIVCQDQRAARRQNLSID